MIILVVLTFSHVITCQSSQEAYSLERAPYPASHHLKKLQDTLAEKFQADRSSPKPDGRNVENSSSSNESAHLSADVEKEEKVRGGLPRKAKSLPLYPYYLPHELVPFAPPTGFYHPQNKEMDNAYATEWLSRTEPFKRNTPLLDSPTYYIRLPPNPYAFVPGLGYVSRPPSLSEPEVFESNKPELQVQSGNDLFHDPFYRLPINFVSNGKPTSIYQLENEPLTKPESNLVNLNKGPYVFNGKPSEIYLVAQIYNALYGDELNHFYP